MATGLIDVGIIKPELANSFAAGYRGAEQSRNLLAQQKQDTEMGQMKLEQLKQDAVALKQFQQRMREVGQSDDPKMFFQEMIRSGRPEYMEKGYEGLRRHEELLRNQTLLRQYAPELFGAAPTTAMAPAAAPEPGSFAADVAARRNALPANAPTAPAAPVNAIAPAAVPAAGGDVNALRRQLVALSSIDDPRAKALAEVVKGQITEASKPYVVGGRLVTGGGKELYAAPDKPTDLQSNYEFAKTPAGGNFKGSLADFKVLATPRTTVNVPVNVSTEKKYGERFGGLIADADAAKLAAAENAPNAAATADRVMDLIGTGKVITGTGANVRLQIAKALNLAGGTDSDKIRNTEVLISSLAETTLGAIKSSNLGAGQGFTNADRDFLEKAKAGQLTYDSKSLTELARLSRLAAEKSAESWNKRVTQIPSSALEGTGISTQPVVVPPRKTSSVMTIPSGAIQALQAGQGTPEQFDAIFGAGSAARVLKGK
jgi:hypothetical protein